MMNPMAKIMVKSVPKSFENVYRIVFSPTKERHKKHFNLGIILFIHR